MSDHSNLKPNYTIGLISDTHGLLRPEVVDSLQGVDRIIHAGDVDKPEVMEALNHIAPVSAVRGNMDKGEWADEFPDTEALEVGEVWLYVIHDLQKLDLDPRAAGFNAVIFGHSHRPFERRENGVLFINPGSAGPQRFSLPISLALLEIENRSVKTRFINL